MPVSPSKEKSGGKKSGTKVKGEETSKKFKKNKKWETGTVFLYIFSEFWIVNSFNSSFGINLLGKVENIKIMEDHKNLLLNH